MAQDPVIPQKSFEEILAWLDPDRNEAANIYVQLRNDLTKIFVWNHCNDPDGLTDEVFDRVGRKVHDLRPNFKGDPKLFFYGVARNLIKESPKRIKKQVSLEDTDLAAPEVAVDDESEAMREECLNSCLQQLSAEKRELILGYYAKERQAKIDHRTELARQMGISVETLRVRVHRIRGTLEKCIERCLDDMGHKMKRIE
jgi:RNA polymerase sigma factor (sigma-70 family)